MIWIKRALMLLIALAAIALAAIYATGNGPLIKVVWDITTGAPDLPFDAETQPGAAPDYSDEDNWAALPWREDLADFVPEDVQNLYEQGQSPVDVFYVHPTGFLKGSSWTFSMNSQTSTAENTLWMMANQASAYNGCCNVYAPRYRQASIFAYMGADEAVRDSVLAFAYQDVERAFEYYLEYYNDGRPFILASHSQGTHHSVGLLHQKIDGTPLAQQLVAAYLIGGYTDRVEFENLTDIALCNSPNQLNCVAHWDTYSESTLGEHEPINTLCTNPLNWQVDGARESRDKHRGAVSVSGEFHLAFSGADSPRGVVFDPLQAPKQNLVSAHCSGGRLFVTDQTDNDWPRGLLMGDTYHLLDYPLFHMDIRDNAILRMRTYLEKHAANNPQADAASAPAE